MITLFSILEHIVMSLQRIQKETYRAQPDASPSYVYAMSPPDCQPLQTDAVKPIAHALSNIIFVALKHFMGQPLVIQTNTHDERVTISIGLNHQKHDPARDLSQGPNARTEPRSQQTTILPTFPIQGLADLEKGHSMQTIPSESDWEPNDCPKEVDIEGADLIEGKRDRFAQYTCDSVTEGESGRFSKRVCERPEAGKTGNPKRQDCGSVTQKKQEHFAEDDCDHATHTQASKSLLYRSFLKTALEEFPTIEPLYPLHEARLQAMKIDGIVRQGQDKYTLALPREIFFQMRQCAHAPKQSFLETPNYQGTKD